MEVAEGLVLQVVEHGTRVGRWSCSAPERTTSAPTIFPVTEWWSSSENRLFFILFQSGNRVHLIISKEPAENQQRRSKERHDGWWWNLVVDQQQQTVVRFRFGEARRWVDDVYKPTDDDHTVSADILQLFNRSYLEQFNVHNDSFLSEFENATPASQHLIGDIIDRLLIGARAHYNRGALRVCWALAVWRSKRVSCLKAKSERLREHLAG